MTAPKNDLGGRRAAASGALLVCALYAFYAASSYPPPITTNDGSHLALVRAIVEKQTFCIDDYADYANYLDVAVVDGHYYSDRPPGTALLASPLYIFGRSLSALLGRSDPSDAAFYAVTFSSLAGAVNVVLLLLLLRRLGVAREATGFCGLAFALGSLNWTYANVFYSHTLVILLTLLHLLFLLQYERDARTRLLVLLGFLNGVASITDYQMFVLIPVTVGVLLWDRVAPVDIACYIAGGLPVLAFFLFYNWTCFGSPFALSYSFHLSSLPITGVGSAYVVPLADGLWSILTHREWGLCRWTPLLLPALIGFPALWRIQNKIAAVAASLAILLVTLTAKLQLHWGGATHDLRYLAPVFPVLHLAYGAALNKYRHGFAAIALRAAAVAAPAFQSVHWSFIWLLGYRFRAFGAHQQIAGAGHWQILVKSVFPAVSGHWQFILLNTALLGFVSYLIQVRRSPRPLTGHTTTE